MGKFYEDELPEGYTEAFTVDASDGKLASKLQVAAAAVCFVLINLFFFSYAYSRLSEIAAGATVLGCIAAAVSYFVYVVLHELTHGLVYMLLTKKKLTFGFKPPAAYCGVPDIYTYRKTSLLSLFAPLTVFSIVFAVLFFTLSGPFARTVILLLFTMHISGCIGDIYGIGLFLFRFRDPGTLRRDFGPKQVYYTKSR